MTLPPHSDARAALTAAAAERILVLDGAMGTMIQQLKLVFLIHVPMIEKGCRKPAHKFSTKGNFVLRPEIAAAAAPDQPRYLFAAHNSKDMTGNIGAQVRW